MEVTSKLHRNRNIPQVAKAKARARLARTFRSRRVNVTLLKGRMSQKKATNISK